MAAAATARMRVGATPTVDRPPVTPGGGRLFQAHQCAPSEPSLDSVCPRYPCEPRPHPSRCQNSTARSGRFWPNQCVPIPPRTHTDSPSTPLPASTTQSHCETAIPTKMRPARLPHAKRTAFRSSQHRHLYTVGLHHYEAGLQHLRSAKTVTSPLPCC